MADIRQVLVFCLFIDRDGVEVQNKNEANVISRLPLLTGLARSIKDTDYMEEGVIFFGAHRR